MPDDKHLAPLRKTGYRYIVAQAELDAARKARDAAIRKALKQGMTHAQIAEATGVSRGRINQLREGKA